MFHVVVCILLLVIYMSAVADQLPRLGKREQICLISFTYGFSSERFSLPFGACDGLRYFIAALYGPSIYFFLFLFSQIDGITGKTWSYEQLQDESHNLRANLFSIGLRQGHVACLYGTNRPEFAHIIQSIAASKAALTIANSQLTPGIHISFVFISIHSYEC